MAELIEHNSLANQFLIAMPALEDPNFARSVTLICEHSDEGAMGIIINRTLDLSFADVADQLELPEPVPGVRQAPVHSGGPVQETRGFVVHTPLGQWDSSLQISEDIGVSSSRDILSAIAAGNGPEAWFLALGYAGWGAGQLESEIQQNAWLNGPVDHDTLFTLPVEQRWSAAAAHMGVDLGHLSGDAGHA